MSFDFRLPFNVYFSLFLLTVITYRQDTVNAAYYIPADYSKSVRPLYWEGEPTKVETGLSVISFGPVDEKDARVTTEIYLRFLWKDKRLAG